MTTIRILGLGNDLLADDAFGVEVLRQLAGRLPPGVETATSIAAGFALLDDVQGADRLVVVDSLAGDPASVGAVHRFDERHAAGEVVAGGSPHYVGLFETLRLGRELGLHVPSEVVILAVAAGDRLTIGGPMSPRMQAVVSTVVELVEQQIARWTV